MSRHTEDAIEKIIVDTIATLRPDGPKADASTPLLGIAAIVDSVGFINLLVALEQNLGGEVDLSTSFMERGDSEENNPFLTVGSLSLHIHELEAAGR